MPDINSNLIRNMGHDVRTSVSSILGLSALAGANVHDKERVMEYLNNINITARQLLDYVDDVMNTVNGSREDNFEKQEINMHALVCSIYNHEKKNIEKHGKLIRLKCDLPEDEIVLGNEARIGHIIRFLIKSSFEYIDVGCSVDVEVKRESLGGAGVVKYQLTCTNNGRQIHGNNENEGSWFENIQDEDVALGLSVVRKMLKSMDGGLSFYTKPGIGNMAELSLCLKLADGSANKAFYTVGESFDMFRKDLGSFLNGKRILIVEDNEINADITRNVLEYMGAVVEWAINGADAIKLVDKSDENFYDMVLMDLQMPELDGYAATTAIRKLNKKYTEKLPIVALTANVMVSNIKQAMDVGMDDYIIKPIEINSIEKMARKFFG